MFGLILESNRLAFGWQYAQRTAILAGPDDLTSLKVLHSVLWYFTSCFIIILMIFLKC